MNELCAKDEDYMIMKEMRERTEWEKVMNELFKDADEDHNHAVDWPEFKKFVADIRVQAYFTKMGLTVNETNAWAFFRLLDFDRDGYIGMDEFSYGCWRLHGNAKS